MDKHRNGANQVRLAAAIVAAACALPVAAFGEGAAGKAPALALRVVDNELQVGTDSAAPYYLQWCTPMGVWANWNEGTRIDPLVPSLWFRGQFEDAQAVDPMAWDPPEDATFYSPGGGGVEGGDGLSWATVGRLDGEGAIQAQAAPEPLSFGEEASPPAYSADPKKNQAMATPDPGRVRLYWQNRTTRAPVIWHLGDTGVRKGGVAVSTSNPSSAWGIAGTGDVDGDGTEDLVWHNSTSGRVVIWFLDPDGVFRSSQQVIDVNLSTYWKIKGVEDMNGDGVPDLIFHHATMGRAHIWYLTATGEYASGSDVADVNLSTYWKIMGIRDMNKDSNPDLIWHHASTGRAHIWFLDDQGKYVSGTNVANVNLVKAWQIKGVEDMNGDANPDLIWHHATTGRAHIWFLNATGNYVSGTNVANVNLATSWKIKGVRDVNEDGNPDLVWHNSSSGRTHTWFLNATGNYVSGTNATSVNLATAWQIDAVSY